MAAPDSPRPEEREPELARLLDTHESLADSYAAQGDWRSAYDHLRAALDLARSGASVRPQIPEQFRLEVEQLRRERAQAQHESLTDALTATYNRRYLDRRLAELHSPSVALVDLDLFKSVNDRFGHLVGDRVLQQVVVLLRQTLPPDAFCARYGGEEFVLVLPRTENHIAVAVTERARAKVATFPWAELRRGLTVTISAGVVAHADFPGNPHGQLREADSLLYAAKRAGRNLVAYRDRGRVRVIRTTSAFPGKARDTVCAQPTRPCP